MNDFVQALGLPFLPHILRRVSDEMVSGGDEWGRVAGITAPSRTTSTLLLLQEEGSRSVTEIAAKLRQSHQLVMVWIKQLSALGLVSSCKDSRDGRKTIVSLTKLGAAEISLIKEALKVEDKAFRALMDEADANIFDALWRIEAALRRKPYVERLREQAPPGTLQRPPRAKAR